MWPRYPLSVRIGDCGQIPGNPGQWCAQCSVAQPRHYECEQVDETLRIISSVDLFRPKHPLTNSSLYKGWLKPWSSSNLSIRCSTSRILKLRLFCTKEADHTEHFSLEFRLGSNSNSKAAAAAERSLNPPLAGA